MNIRITFSRVMLLLIAIAPRIYGADPASADTQLPQPGQPAPAAAAPAGQPADAGANPSPVVPPQTAPATPTNAAALPNNETVVAAPATNAASSATAVNTTPEWLQRDQAITPEDQGMLAQMRQSVFQGQPTAAWMESIHFILKDGAVRLVGTVPSPQERERIEGVVRQIPGVVRIYNALAVNPAAAVATGTAPAPAPESGSGVAPGPVLPPTSYPATNANGNATPNLPATNNVYENPPAVPPR